ncbi:fibrous sheath-interacting protein 2-like isoform X4 [Equus przewalskii]|uniref:Fibrous sheath-interacting protein 2-like isoform X4 n=1 Tax=Equus przewalskii TaxID=9798 RepID=A0ABM4N957_EQUPR
MDLYLSNCYKAAQAAATKAAASSLTVKREKCDTLYQSSYDFNLTDPYGRLLETSYKSLHDPHLKAYYKRKDILRRLRKGGYITSNNKVVCTLKELNKYRQYLTSLKLDFERNYVRKQTMIKNQVNKLYEIKRAYENYENAPFQKWLLQESPRVTPDEELLIKNRYVDMISRELDKVEHMAEEQSALQMKEEERRHRDHIKRKLRHRRQIEEEWKKKEMLLLSKIEEEVKRKARVEEQRRKTRQETHQKKQGLLEKKIAYHLQKMQMNELKKVKQEGITFESKGQDETEVSSAQIKKMSDATSDQKFHHGQKRSTHHSHGFVKLPAKKSTSSPPRHDVQSNTPEQKKDKEMTKASHPLHYGGIKSTSSQAPDGADKTKDVPRHSPQDILQQEVTFAELSGKKAKKLSLNCDPDPPGAHQIFPSRDSSVKQQNYYQNHCQEKVTSEELSSIIHNIMTWVVAAVTNVLYPAITKYEERLRNSTYPMPDDSTVSSDSPSCYSTCSEKLLYETRETFQAKPCAKAADKMECLARTGHSIEALRRMSARGSSYSKDVPDAGKRKREKRISLDEAGRLNVKPLETASRNSFQNLIKPDITKVELLKDVQSKKDLIIRLVAHDIEQEESKNKVEEGLTSDEDEVVLQEVGKEKFPEGPFEDQVKEDVKPTASTVAFPKPLMSKSNLKKCLSLGKSCHPKSSVTTTNTKASPTQWPESEETQIRKILSKADVTTLESSTDTDSSFWGRKTSLSVEEMKSSTKPSSTNLHQIMSTSSYNEEALPSFSSVDDNSLPDPSAKITEDSLECPDLENASSIKFTTLFQRESALAGLHSSNDDIPDADKPSTSKQGSEMMRKVSSALPKVFSICNASAPQTPSPSPLSRTEAEATAPDISEHADLPQKINGL